MTRFWFVCVILLLLIPACGEDASTQEPVVVSEITPTEGTLPEPTLTQAPVVTTDTGEELSATEAPGSVPPGSEIPTPIPFEGSVLPLEKSNLFGGSGSCAICHTKMVDETGEDVSTDRLWRGTMMANAARDPYWQATVRAEILKNPEYQEAIEDKCATCHMPMARLEAHLAGNDSLVLDSGFSSPDHPMHPLAMDAVSCNVCHQVLPDNFGEAESFSGGFIIDTQKPMGERESFGPYKVGKQLATIMQSVSGFKPLLGPHVEQSELCGTCHNLYTPYLDENGQIAGELPEQTTHLEWLFSDYSEETSCQGCHMPDTGGGVQLSTTGGPLREPFFQHYFVGGNAYMAAIFQTYGEELGVTASSENFATTSKHASDQLQNRTANLMLEDINLEGEKITGKVIIQNLAGHKFPAGFPARRAWLHLEIEDANGQVIFESGAVNPDGSIVGNDNDEDLARFEPHYKSISSPDQVQIYESIMVDTLGDVTTTLLRGAGYIKDNRLLPVGFDGAAAPADILSKGAALDDNDFQSGGDLVQFEIDLSNAQGPFKVKGELFYQTIGFRWATNLRGIDSLETERFIRYYDSVQNIPLVVAVVETQVSE